MPLGVPFKDSKARKGYPDNPDNITIRQYNRKFLRFKRSPDRNSFYIEIPAEIVGDIKITRHNAIRLAKWIFASTELNGVKSPKANVATKSKADRESSQE